MQFKISKEPLSQIKADVVALLCQQKVKDKKDKGIAILQKSDGGWELDKRLDGLLSKIIRDENFRGEAASCKLVYTGGKIPARAVLLVGAGKPNDFSLEVLRKIGGKIAGVANDIKASSVVGAIQAENVKGFLPSERLEALAQGFLLGSYKFEQYKDKKDVEPDTLKEVILTAKSGEAKLEAAIQRAKIISEGVCFVRDLVNTPAKDMTPDILAKKAKEVALKARFSCEVWGRDRIEKEKMGLFLAVARGSENEPRFIHLSYKPSGKARAKVALVGKGITFDTGGYSLKPPRAMINMKDDMAGAATVIAVTKIASELKIPVAVSAYIPATDNMIDAKAELPGNIVKARSGKTVEIDNMDAEGRLILADAIDYALQNKPDFLIDIATLTGGVLYALGEIFTAVLGNDQKLIDKYLAAAKRENEYAWPLPLVKEYKKSMTEGLADLKNTSKTRAQTIEGALFLEEFVDDAKWVHLDIAETVRTEEGNDYTPKGPTGGVVRSLVRLLSSF